MSRRYRGEAPDAGSRAFALPLPDIRVEPPGLSLPNTHSGPNTNSGLIKSRLRIRGVARMRHHVEGGQSA